jgi:hypothetical protein
MLQVEPLNERRQVVGPLFEREQPLRLVAESTAYVIDRHAAVARPQGLDQISPVKRPCRVPVHKKQRLAVAPRVVLKLVEVVQPSGRQIQPMGLERVPSPPILATCCSLLAAHGLHCSGRSDARQLAARE